MRTIKFKGKRVDNGEWVYGFGVVMDWFRGIYIIAKVGDPIVAHIDMVEVIEETIGQFTGLTDKNGKEIYEGDVCVSEYVDFDGAEDGRKYLKFVVDHEKFNYYGKSLIVRDMNNVEVIGNIHDIPELIGGSK